MTPGSARRARCSRTCTRARCGSSSLATGEDRVVAQEDGVTFGLAEFVAAEEMGRARGYWWSPDGSGLLIARVDESPVTRWHIADPANPDKQPAEVAYPAAGTPNADVSLVLATRADSSRVELTPVGWDRDRFPYLVTVSWDKDLLIVVQSRDQKTMRVFNGHTGETVREDSDPQWTDIIGGVPAQLADGSVAWTEISEDTRRLVVAQPGELAGAGPVTPAGLQVRRILGTDGNDVLFQASTDPVEAGVWRYGPGGLREVATGPGVHTATAGGGTTVLSSRTLDSTRLDISVAAGDGTAARRSPHSPRNPVCRCPPRTSSRPGRTRSAPPCSSRPGMSRARRCRC